MKINFWKRINYIVGLISVLILFCLVILYANNEVKDLDLWLHLKTGQFIVENKTIPDKDIFSFSLANKPWINHEWFFQAAAFLLYEKGGLEGIISLQVIIVVLTFLILMFLGHKQDNYFKIVSGLLLVLLVYRTRFTIRPDIFSLLFFSIYLYMLNKHLDSKAIVYILPAVQILWVNSHGFFSLGIVILFLYIVAEFLKRSLKFPFKWNESKLSDVAYQRLKMLFLLVILASFANPYTFKGVVYPFSVLGQLAGKSRIFFQHIQELKPSLSLKNIFYNDGLVYYKLMILLSGLSFYLNRRRLNLNLLFLWLLFLPLSIIAIRNIVFFSFVAYVVLITNIEEINFGKIAPLNFREDRFKQVSKLMFGIILILWMVRLGSNLSYSGYYVFDNYEMKSSFQGVSQRAYPRKAIDFILENKISGNIFNDFNSGAYLIGKAFPQIKVFIDGRTEVYGPDFFESYRKILDGETALFEKTVKEYNVKIVLLSSVFHKLPEKFLSYLYKSPGWKLVYFDEYAVIFLSNIPENKQIIEKFRIDLDRWVPPKIDLLRLGSKKVYPYININRANALDALELDKPVLRETEGALKIMPDCAEAYNLNGQVYMRENSWLLAFENFRLAAAYLPSNPEIRTNLGMAYLKLKDVDSAVKQFKLAMKAAPNYANPYYQLALIQMDKKDYKQASGLLKKAVKIDAKQIKYQEKLAGSLFLENKFTEACAVLQKALEIEAKNVEIHNKLADCYLAMGLTQEAERQYQKTLEIEPQNKEARKKLLDLRRKD